MAYDEYLAERVRINLKERHIPTIEKKMMGGLCFMVEDKMCVGINDNRLMARVGVEKYEDALKKEGCKKMDFTGREMKGFVYIEPEAIDRDSDLDDWIQLCLDYNPKAKKSKNK